MSQAAALIPEAGSQQAAPITAAEHPTPATPALAGRQPPAAADPLEVAGVAARIARENLRAEVVRAVHSRGLSEVAAARLAGVARSTVRGWLGKG